MRINAPTSALRVLSNPVAYRILNVIGVRGSQTTDQLAGILEDVPTSSLYRQLSRLREAGILRVVGERQARGAVERTYALAARDAGVFAADDLAALSAAQLRMVLKNFIAMLVADTSAYLASRGVRKSRAKVGAALAVCDLSDDEYTVLQRDLHAAIVRAREQAASGSTTKRRYFYLVTLPELATK